MKLFRPAFFAAFGIATLSLSPTLPAEFRRGDCNNDGQRDIADAVSALNLLFQGIGPPLSGRCEKACDANDDGTLDVSDAVTILLVLFTGEASFPPPLECGSDPTEDSLGCAEPGCTLDCEPHLLRSATGFPDVSVTDRSAAMSSIVEAPLALAWSVTGFLVRIDKSLTVVGLAGVAEDDGTPAELLSDLSARLNIHSSREAFERDALRGDMLAGHAVELAASPLPFGSSLDAREQRHYLTFEFEPFALPPGEYVFSIPVSRVGPEFAWAETRAEIESSFITNDANVGRSVRLAEFDGYSTGAAAVDVLVQLGCD